MPKLILNSEFSLYEQRGKPFCDSLQIAEGFNKRHDNVLRDVNHLDCSGEFRLLNFEETSYKDEQGKKQPKILMTKDGFMFLVMGYRGKKAARIKEAYINRFNAMENFITSLFAAKMEHPAFTRAIMDAHEEPKHYHFSNEADMINRIVTGMTAKQFRECNGLDKGASIRPHLTYNQMRAVEELQRIDIGLVLTQPDFEERKKFLAAHYQDKIILRLSA